MPVISVISVNFTGFTEIPTQNSVKPVISVKKNPELARAPG
jgi:hypothetical protein